MCYFKLSLVKVYVVIILESFFFIFVIYFKSVLNNFSSINIKDFKYLLRNFKLVSFLLEGKNGVKLMSILIFFLDFKNFFG